MQLKPGNELSLTRSHSFPMPGHRFVARLILCQSWLYFHLNFTHCRHAFLPKTVNTTGTGMMDLLNQLSSSSLTCQPQHLAYRPHWIQLMSCSQELLCIFRSPDPRYNIFHLSLLTFPHWSQETKLTEFWQHSLDKL